MAGTSNPNAPGGDTPVDSSSERCPLESLASNPPKSIHIKISWTFSSGVPKGKYELKLSCQPSAFTGELVNGEIKIDKQLYSVDGSGELKIAITDGPIFKAKVNLGMPEIQTCAGLAQRLTNLGFYAGTTGEFDDRAKWAIRAFKRVVMNKFTRNTPEVENNTASKKFLEEVQKAYGGAHPGDSITGALELREISAASVPCGMFGSRTYRRGSFEVKNAKDDKDPTDAGDKGIWEGTSAKGLEEPIAGTFTIYLRAFDPAAGDPEIKNRVNLPQPIHMAQFVLFELGYWLVRGDANDWKTLTGTETRNKFTPDGEFNRYMQWATREFQCHAKFKNAAKENVASTEQRYLPRLFEQSPIALMDIQRYPENGMISGALNEATRSTLQAWADNVLRCPVIIYASTDNNNATANGSDLTKIKKENLWLYDDHKITSSRMYVIDYSKYYTIPEPYTGSVNNGGFTFPRPIVIGEYSNADVGGPVSLPIRHSWNSEHVEVRPDTLIGSGGSNGAVLTESQLSTFKVVRTAAHFECLGYLDCFNAYDKVTISFGPCHWTLAYCHALGKSKPEDGREMPAFFSYMLYANPSAYQDFFGIFGLAPKRDWLTITRSKGTRTYEDKITIQTEKGNQILCGASGSDNEKYLENTYGRNWHLYYRFQMACRTSSDLQHTMWDFARIRVRDIVNGTLHVAGQPRRVGDYITSEKGVAMLQRWHIYGPADLFSAHYLRDVLAAVIALPTANQLQLQAREDAVLQNLSNIGGPRTNQHLTTIYGWTNIPQQSSQQQKMPNYYHLKLDNPILSSNYNSFHFDDQGLPPLQP